MKSEKPQALAIHLVPKSAIRHAAALALVGWYLMVPPLANAPWKVSTEAPISQWQVYRTFPSENECEKFQSAARAKYEPTSDAELGTIKKGTQAFARQMTFAECIASDDPSLKGN